MKKVITIIPAYNEEKTVSCVVSAAKKYSDEVVVIDDGSVDLTGKNAEMAGAVVVSNGKNKGLGVSVRRGYEEALRRGADIVVQIDADDQYVASDIPKLVKPVAEGRADMVIASRFLGGIEQMSLAKRVGNCVFTFLTNVVAGTRLSDAQSGFRAIDKRIIKRIMPSEPRGYTHETLIKAARAKVRIFEVPSYFRARQCGG
ncbi:MAG: glycosyltransferase family 2 protein, partial [Candidatus Woesearchaeota archaeon]